MAAARLRMWARVLLEEADALIDVLRVPVDGRHRDAGEVVREEAAGSVVVAVGGAVAAALPVRGAAGEEAQVPRAPRGDAAEDFDDERHHVVVLVVDGVIVVALVEGDVALAGVVVEGRVGGPVALAAAEDVAVQPLLRVSCRYVCARPPPPTRQLVSRSQSHDCAPRLTCFGRHEGSGQAEGHEHCSR